MARWSCSSIINSVILWTLLFSLCVVDFHVFLLAEAAIYPYVTCGSVLKLLNKNFQLRLHSHEVKYASGSGQQSVTAIEKQDDVNSHWFIKGKNGKSCNRGEPVKCGDTIRFGHLETLKNLHSHHFSAPLSGNQEVSAFGTHGEGDSGDNWVITCSSDFWEREGSIRLKHGDTDMWLSVSGQTYGRPITGQKEVCGIAYSDSSCYWKATEGVYIKPSELPNPQLSHVHTEL